MNTEVSKVKWINQFTFGNAVTLLGGLAVAGVIWGTTITRLGAVETKVEENDRRDRVAETAVNDLKVKIGEIASEQKGLRRDADRIGEQLTRIEHLLRSYPPLQPRVP